ncbi:hypothetical protein SDC9_212297 [bioreactor metagenome]|uniref:Uncharacterized protein n=1 Tax=bioreactor metagenome TaxID=1076179 RepID=A0A645JMJ8_9ZZZZ
MTREAGKFVFAIIGKTMVEVAFGNGLAAIEQSGQLLAEQIADARK